MNPIKHAYFLLAVSFGLLTLLVCGCGGGNGSQSAQTGRAVFTLTWPTRSRLIPLAANSVRVTLKTPAGTLVTEKVIARPADGVQGTADFTNLKPGALTATATAYPNADATGTAQATATVPFTIQQDMTNTVDITMESTITRLTVSPINPSILARTSTNFTATAYNAANQVVLVAPGKLSWTSGTTSVALIDGSGKADGLEGGTSNITVTDTESNKTTGTTLTVTPSGLAQSAWPKFRGNYQNTGAGTAFGASGVVAWQFPSASNDGVVLGPDGTLYFGTAGTVNGSPQTFYALDPVTHTARWSIQIPGGATGTPILGRDGNLYFGTRSVVFYSINAQTGAQNWARNAPNRGFYTGSPAMAADGTLYVPADENFSAINPRTGETKWTFSLGSDSLFVAPAVGPDGTVYVSDLKNGYYALDPATGTALWRFAPADRQFSGASPVVAPNGSVIVTAGTKIYSLNHTTGLPDWSFTEENVVGSTPVVDKDGNIYTSNPGEQHAATFLTKLGPDGSVKWQKPGVYAPMAIDGAGVLYVQEEPDGARQLLAIDSRTGDVKWRLPMSVGTEMAIAADGTLYLRASGMVTAVR